MNKEPMQLNKRVAVFWLCAVFSTGALAEAVVAKVLPAISAVYR